LKKYFLKHIQHFREEFEKLYKRPDETMRFRVVHRAIGREERENALTCIYLWAKENFSLPSVRPSAAKDFERRNAAHAGVYLIRK
jgi:hypothetical protein